MGQADLGIVILDLGKGSPQPDPNSAPICQPDPEGPAPAATACQRRERLIEALRQPQRAALSDRALGRQFGVSPQTVTTWRRKLAEEALQR
ncbi:hypothetical protein [Chelatococcus reniformis]|uniref:Uncharacterized protein n=1 Tax=Chelatococcus reniformis TaxID=1494448 RepID=A0A916UXL3_9HYPH|nr:hypothetical protein [Chelatococcus reniformis]GGC91692.1 hypothetical protein GCM10010994_56820 [Chelatococcus reniformis]